MNGIDTVCWLYNEKITHIIYDYMLRTNRDLSGTDWSHTCIAINFFAASEACLPICRGSMTRTTISPLRSTASRAAAVEASWSFSTVSICLKISVLIPLTCNDRSCHFRKRVAKVHHRCTRNSETVSTTNPIAHRSFVLRASSGLTKR